MDSFQLRELRRLTQDVTARIVREVVDGLKKYPQGARLSGDDSKLGGFWEEWKCQVQRESSFCWDLYEETVREHCRLAVKTTPIDVQGVMWLFSDGYLEWDWDREGCEIPYGDPVQEALTEEVFALVFEVAESEELQCDLSADDEE